MIICAAWRRGRMFVAVVRLTDPGTAVEEEGEPPDPAPELHPADCLDSWGKVDRPMPERGEDAESGLRGPVC